MNSNRQFTFIISKSFQAFEFGSFFTQDLSENSKSAILNTYGNIPSREQATYQFDSGFLVVYRVHTDASLNIMAVFYIVDGLPFKIAYVGNYPDVIVVTCSDNYVTIQNNYTVAVYVETLGR